MSSSTPGLEQLPPDPTFPPAAYERTARLLRYGVLGFFALACLGLLVELLQHPGETLSTLLSSQPTSGGGAFSDFLPHLAAFRPSDVILLGIFIMVAVTVGRVVYAAVDFYKGREQVLALLSGLVVALLVMGLVIVAPFVH